MGVSSRYMVMSAIGSSESTAVRLTCLLAIRTVMKAVDVGPAAKRISAY